jgi:hypothetical protein
MFFLSDDEARSKEPKLRHPQMTRYSDEGPSSHNEELLKIETHQNHRTNKATSPYVREKTLYFLF